MTVESRNTNGVVAVLPAPRGAVPQDRSAREDDILNKHIPLTAALGAALTVTACTKREEAPARSTPEVATSIAGLNPCDPVDVDKSVVVHDQATISQADFSFQRTIQAIRNSSGGAATTDAALAQTLTSGLLNASFTNPISGLSMAAQARTAEAGLTGAGLLSQMQPIALFNRFDLAPSDGSNCGEYRIVYGRYPNSTFNRFLVIFEARLPNPTPSAGLAGCMPVAAFWHDLSDPGHTAADRATLLADFYYNGLPGFSPVVSHANYGVPLGQVRSNMFMQGPWQLREFRASFNTGGAPVFSPDTVKENPLAQFYNENSFTAPLFVSEQGLFETAFQNTNMPELLDFELNGATVAACPEINSVGTVFDDRFNEFQSDSQGSGDEPNAIASSNFRTGIDGVLSGNAAFSSLTNTHVLNRAGTVTCGGCHQFSVGKEIAPGVTWPASAGFVHVDEQGAAPPAVATLSTALDVCFVPARKEILEGFVCGSGTPPDAGVSDAGTPDSGAVVQCGGGLGNTCAANEYCEFGMYNACGVNGPGVCTPRPVSCGYTVAQVCGCDGVTYKNECSANAAGTDVSSTGACPGSCGGPVPSGCCYDDSQCALQMKGGYCVGESCSASSPGVCKAPDPKGGCWEDTDCARGEFCDGERICPCGQRCLQADQPGICRPVISNPPREEIQMQATSSQTTSELENTKQALIQAPNEEEAERALEDFEAAVREARAREHAIPGAFWRVRRTH